MMFKITAMILVCALLVPSTMIFAKRNSQPPLPDACSLKQRDLPVACINALEQTWKSQRSGGTRVADGGAVSIPVTVGATLVTIVAIAVWNCKDIIELKCEKNRLSSLIQNLGFLDNSIKPEMIELGNKLLDIKDATITNSSKSLDDLIRYFKKAFEQMNRTDANVRQRTNPRIPPTQNTPVNMAKKTTNETLFTQLFALFTCNTSACQKEKKDLYVELAKIKRSINNQLKFWNVCNDQRKMFTPAIVLPADTCQENGWIGKGIQANFKTTDASRARGSMSGKPSSSGKPSQDKPGLVERICNFVGITSFKSSDDFIQILRDDSLYTIPENPKFFVDTLFIKDHGIRKKASDTFEKITEKAWKAFQVYMWSDEFEQIECAEKKLYHELHRAGKLSMVVELIRGLEKEGVKDFIRLYQEFAKVDKYSSEYNQYLPGNSPSESREYLFHLLFNKDAYDKFLRKEKAYDRELEQYNRQQRRYNRQRR